MTFSTPTLRRAARALVAGAATVLVLAGCMRLDVELTVHSDDTVDATTMIAVSDATAEQLGMDPAVLWEQMEPQLLADLPEGATHELIAEDGFTGARVVLPRTPLAEFAGVGAEELSIVRDGDEFVLSGAMDLTDADPGEIEDVDLTGMRLRVTVTFPGEVTEHDGTLSGTTVTWEPEPGQVTEMNARASADGAPGAGAGAGTGEAAGGNGVGRTALIAGLAVLVVGGGTAAALLAKHRRDRGRATTDGENPEPAVPAEPPQQPDGH